MRLVQALSRATIAFRCGLLARRWTIPADEIADETGQAVVVPLGTRFDPGDGTSGWPASELRLFEDGRELGPAHAPHEDIRKLGSGRFSHWQASLYFSSGDGTSPRTNGRTYRAVVPSRLSSAAARAVATAYRRLGDGTRRLAHRVASQVLPGGGASSTLYVFYDLAEAPVTYDVTMELVIAEFERRARGLDALHLVLVPGKWRLRHLDGYRDAVGDDAVEMRLSQLALPIAALLPSCRGVTLCGSRQEAEWMRFGFARHVHPRHYDPRRPLERSVDLSQARSPRGAAGSVFPLLRANGEARRAVDAFLAAHAGGRRAVVVTLRQYGFVPSRNSRVEDWIAFADGLDPARYAVVFVPDTARALETPHPGLERHVVFAAASWNVGLRMALYEAAHLNLAHMGGPMELVLYNEACRYAVFIPVGGSPQTRAELLTERGFRIGHDLPFARPGQRIVWEPDELPVIRRVFSEMEGAPGPAPSARAGDGR